MVRVRYRNDGGGSDLEMWIDGTSVDTDQTRHTPSALAPANALHALSLPDDSEGADMSLGTIWLRKGGDMSAAELDGFHRYIAKHWNITIA